MVDPISNNMAAPMGGQADVTFTANRPEPAVHVTQAEAARNGGSASGRHGDATSYGEVSGNVEEAFEEINSAMEAWATGMRFELDEDTQQMVVSIIDTKTGDVLRQIPSEEVLHVAKIIAQFQGKLVSVKA